MSSPSDSTPERNGVLTSLTPLHSRTPVGEVANRLLELFTSADFLPGDRLPSERTLTTTLGVGRSAVREALAALEILGIVDVRAGSGTYLRGGASDLLPQTMSWGLLIGERPTRELLEMRCELEIFAARLATDRATDADLKALGEHLATMEANLDNLKRFVAADRAYHRRLLAAAGNSVLVGQMDTIHSMLRVWLDRAVDDRGHAVIAAKEHRALLEAMQARDPIAATTGMVEHMLTATARIEAISDYRESSS